MARHKSGRMAWRSTWHVGGRAQGKRDGEELSTRVRRPQFSYAGVAPHLDGAITQKYHGVETKSVSEALQRRATTHIPHANAVADRPPKLMAVKLVIMYGCARVRRGGSVREEAKGSYTAAASASAAATTVGVAVAQL
jgi:hypothetical protein